MGSHKSKEDDVSKISTSIFITNFPVTFSAKDLFNACKQYGHVVDAYIPIKRSKAGKRFGFVRFINVFNEERLVNNLCTIWVGRLKLHANSVRFHRTPLNKKNHQPNNYVGVNRRSTHVYQKDMGQSGVGNSYVQVVKGNNTSVVAESDHTPTLVLDDECLNTSDLSNSLMGRVKEFASLSNLKMVLHKEGFDNIKIQYMGELWVLLEFDSEASKKLFHANVGVGSWFSQLIQASKDFTIEGRIVWVEIEGIPFKLWSDNTFKRIASKWGDLLHIDDQDENCFHSKRLCIKTKVGKNIIEAFKIIFRGKVCWIRAKEVTGWVPDFLEESDDEHDSDDDVNEGDLNAVDSDVDENHSEDPFNIYELLNKKKDNVESEDKSEHSPQYPPGYTPKDGIETFCNNGENSKKESGEFSQGGHEEGVNDIFKDTGSNKGSKDDVAESVCSGHFKKSVYPRTGGSILNLMEELVKVGQTMGYNMDGCMNNMTEIIESQRVKEGANVLNSFIVNAGLEEIPLATSLERYLSDHRPILLRESHFDFGPTLFRFFHSWFEMEGFNKLVEDAWNEAPVDESNAMSNMMKKLKYLKQKIRDWNKGNMKSSKNIKAKLKDDLKAVDDIIDNGEGNDEVVKLRMDVLKSIQDIDKIQSLDAAQKAKIKWSIEGDENSSFYHGVLNKKRSQLNIRGILVDGTWVDNPQRVKNEFLHHFSKRFDKPAANRASLVMNFSKILSCDQQVELELEVSKDEVKRAVWDCGTDKAPGPDGFTFGFYRRFWKVIENDVFDAVNHFFTYGDIPKGCNSSFIALIPKIPDANVCVDARMFKGITLSSSLMLSHMFYADDVIFVGQWCDDNINTLVQVLECFFHASGVSSLEMVLENWMNFSAASVRKMLDDKMLPDVTTKTRWIKLVPIKVNVHAWKVKIDSLPTRFNISRRGMDIESITCSICDNEVESSSHLFFKCNMVRDIIRKITRWWDITYIEADSYEDWLNWLVNLRLSSNYKQALEGVFYVMWWHVWQYRNKYIFEAVSSSKAMIFEDIVSRSFYWCRNRCKASFSWNDWLKNPYLVAL
ncbi:RNA-directed DNA polymerase, eukaryota [Tanacetum coccineum]|uniref:RNA-directed DNA polymerase, eukaryota n=1 Tax=Tanacetum coccineum TaxID=301880 RepID=A0ABQ4XYI6_9ASTR